MERTVSPTGLVDVDLALSTWLAFSTISDLKSIIIEIGTLLCKNEITNGFGFLFPDDSGNEDYTLNLNDYEIALVRRKLFSERFRGSSIDYNGYKLINSHIENSFGDIRYLVVSSSKGEECDVVMIEGILSSFLDIVHIAEMRARSRTTAKLWRDITDYRYSVDEAFVNTLNWFSNAISHFFPIQMRELIVAQVLMVSPESSSLYMRGSTDDNIQSYPIAYDSSVVGSVVQSKLAYTVIDPRISPYSSLYLRYSGLEQAQCKCELVVSLYKNNEIVGVINLEHCNENAFSNNQIADMIESVHLLSDIFIYLEGRWQLTYEEFRIETKNQAFYFNAHASSFKHDWQYFTRLGYDIDLLKRAISQADVSALDKVSESLRDAQEVNSPLYQGIADLVGKMIHKWHETNKLTARHINRFENIGERQKYDLRELIDSVIADFKMIQKTRPELLSVSISNDVPSRVVIGAYSLFPAYIYQIFENSRRSLIDKAAIETGFVPKIAVSYDVKEFDNGRWKENYIFLRVTDNGLGVSAKALADLRRMNPERTIHRKGQGRALIGAYRYMRHQSGWLQIDAEEGNWFEVTLAFRRRVGV